MKQVFTLIEFEYDREVLPTEIQAAITKLLGVYPVKVEARPTPRAADGAWDCQNCKKPNINAASKCWFCETPRR
jgi:hypothetical protein